MQAKNKSISRQQLNELAQFKYVIFDIGNVLIKCGPDYLFKNSLGYGMDEVNLLMKEVFNSDFMMRVDIEEDLTTLINHRISQQPRYEKQLSQFLTKWEMTMGPVIDEMIDCAMSLKKIGVPLFAISNWPKSKIKILEDRIDVRSLFLDIVYSGEVGLAKPNEEIFRYSLNHFRIKPENYKETLFIDDNEKT